MKINIDELLANMPKDEDELKTVQEKHRKILTDNREKEKQRKARTHRLCEHGAILEACFPETIQMDSAQFSAFCWPVTMQGGVPGVTSGRPQQE